MKKHIVMLAFCMAGSLHAAADEKTGAEFVGEPQVWFAQRKNGAFKVISYFSHEKEKIEKLIGPEIRLKSEASGKPATLDKMIGSASVTAVLLAQLPKADENRFTKAFAIHKGIVARALQSGATMNGGIVEQIDWQQGVVAEANPATYPMHVSYDCDGNLCVVAAGPQMNSYIVSRQQGQVCVPVDPIMFCSSSAINRSARWLVEFNGVENYGPGLARVKLHDLDTPGHNEVLYEAPSGPPNATFGFAFSGKPDSPSVALVSLQEAMLWHKGEKRVIARNDYYTDMPLNEIVVFSRCTFSPDGRYLYISSNNFVWRYDNDNEKHVLDSYRYCDRYTNIRDVIGGARDIAVTPSGELLAVSDPCVSGVSLFETSNMQLVCNFPEANFELIGFGDDGKFLSSGYGAVSADSVWQITVQNEKEDAKPEGATVVAQPAPSSGRCITQ